MGDLTVPGKWLKPGPVELRADVQMKRWPVVPRYVAAKDLFKLFRQAWIDSIGGTDVSVTRAINGAEIVLDVGLPKGLVLAIGDSTMVIDVNVGTLTDANDLEDEAWTCDISAARSEVLDPLSSLVSSYPS